VRAAWSLEAEERTGVSQLLYSAFTRMACDRFVWKLDSQRLRILCYHGVCEDWVASEAWTPSYFVTRSAFEAQLSYLQRNARVLPLGEAVERLREGSLPPQAVTITFDDGYANNLDIAYPLLRKYKMPATIFLSTRYAESDELLPFLKLKLIQVALRAAGKDPATVALPDYKSTEVDIVRESAGRWWADLGLRLTDDQRDALRVMRAEDLKSIDFDLIEVGAHSDTHCILKNENRERRRREIGTSVEKISEWTGRKVRLFSYPNGQRGDFDQDDKDALTGAGVQIAVSGISGANGPGADFLELRRYPVTLHHDDCRFRAEVAGFRNTLRWIAGARD
jgi:peptidoglycan/xylan/chitin deacetylase (PgdA/CDA1 family)